MKMQQTMPDTQNAFRALADPTRRGILLHLSRTDMTIGEVVDCFTVTRAAIKKHLVILENGGLIKVKAQGRERINSLNPTGLKIATDWLNYFNQFWTDRLDDLKNIAEADETMNKTVNQP